MATWLLRPPAMSSRRRRSSAVMVMNAGSRDPQSLTMARRVSSCVVNGPGVNSSGDSGTSTSLLGGASVGMLGDHAPQSPSGEQHHESGANTGCHEEGRAPPKPDNRSQKVEQVVEIEAERARKGFAARSIQSLQRLR